MSSLSGSERKLAAVVRRQDGKHDLGTTTRDSKRVSIRASTDMHTCVHIYVLPTSVHTCGIAHLLHLLITTGSMGLADRAGWSSPVGVERKESRKDWDRELSD